MEFGYWPPFDVRIRTPRLELRPIHGDVVWEVIALADRGIHDPTTMPFSIAWTDAPVPQRHWESVRHYHEAWTGFRPERWTFPFASYHDGELVGVQSVLATDFTTLRTVESGSWIGREFQGRGFGVEQRCAVLALAFEGFNALVAETAAWHDNTASNAVTTRIGYEPNGETTMARRGQPDRMLRYRLTAEQWRRRRDELAAVEIEGVEAVLPMLGLA